MTDERTLDMKPCFVRKKGFATAWLCFRQPLGSRMAFEGFTPQKNPKTVRKIDSSFRYPLVDHAGRLVEKIRLVCARNACEIRITFNRISTMKTILFGVLTLVGLGWQSSTAKAGDFAFGYSSFGQGGTFSVGFGNRAGWGGAGYGYGVTPFAPIAPVGWAPTGFNGFYRPGFVVNPVVAPLPVYRPLPVAGPGFHRPFPAAYGPGWGRW
jgi:hypothetical protein